MKVRRIKAVLALFCALCFTNVAVVESDASNALLLPNMGFAVDIYKTIGSETQGKNVFLSPISISTAFAMVNLGARGNTRTQIKSVLNLKKVKSDYAVNKAFWQLLKKLKSQTNNYTLQIANRLFGNNEFNFSQKYLQESEKYFLSSLEALDFAENPEKSRAKINDWVAGKTNDKIKDLIPSGSFDSMTTLVLVNAIYYKAAWLFPFLKDQTKPGRFHISKTEDVSTDIMLGKEATPLKYHKSVELHCQILELPYVGGKSSMFIFLPHKIDGLSSLEKRLTGQKLRKVLGKVELRPITVQLPKFQMNEGISLKKFLQLMGMTDVFNGHSDLSGIGKGGLYVSEAIHKAFVNVDEIGTEAAAVTGIEIKIRSKPRSIKFKVDRPFLFLILDKDTETVLFIGRLHRPPSAKESLG